MRAAFRLAGAGSQAVSYFLGLVVLLLAAAVWATSLPAADVLDWVGRIFGTVFLVALGALVFLALSLTVSAFVRSSRSAVTTGAVDLSRTS